MSEPVVKSCEICKAPMEEALQDYLIEMDGQEILVEDVPMWVCEQCGYTEVEDDVLDAVEDMLEHMETVVHDTGDEASDAS
ncbi:MAG: YgiT-type zinc finger protein [Candidatus Promineifilaceae bacterium]|nr:YgiT-type zinc finger protein [Candidatus Promineifilaceae bacterium]